MIDFIPTIMEFHSNSAVSISSLVLMINGSDLSPEVTAITGGNYITNQSTIDKLIEMRLTTMADAFRTQLNDSKMKDVPYEDRFGMMVDIQIALIFL